MKEHYIGWLKFIYIIGLPSEAEKYAKILGYNYNSSKWYEKSYFILNKEYHQNRTKKIKKLKKDKNNSINHKIKSLFK